MVSDTRGRGYYFDELAEGDQFDCGGITVTDEAVIRFAMEWDMQSFHVDAEAAKSSIFGGLVGSGLQTLLLCYRLYFQRGLLEGTALAGLGMDAIRFHAPLRPGQTLRVQARVDSKRPSSRPGRGILTWALTGLADGEVIFSMKLTALVAAREAQVTDAAFPQTS